MNDPIKIEARDISGNSVPTVNARELHAFLEVGKVFAAWIQERITQYSFSEHNDYVMTVSKTGIRQNVIQKDYHLSIDMAKELAMVERNEKGRQARLYFIECERRAKAAHPATPALPDFTNPAAAARAWAAEFERRQALEQETAQQAKVLAVTVPKAAVFDDLHHRPGCMCIRDAAKNIGVGERALIRKLIEVGWLYRRDLADGRQGSLKASAYTMERGYFEHQPRTGRDGAVRDSLLVTVKGLHKLTYNVFQVWGFEKERCL
jgi:anti-repressor protein